jgi:hypothetical protein
MTDTDVTHGNAIAETLSRSFEQSLQQQRSLWEQVNRFAREESYRFGSRQLQQANKALDNMHTSQGVTGLISAHHDWLREMVQDYADQSMRYSEMMRNFSSNAFATAMDAGRRNMAMGQDAMRAAAGQAEETAQTIQDTGHAMAETASQGMTEAADQIVQQGAEPFGNAHLHH